MLELVKPYIGQIASFAVGLLSGAAGVWVAFGGQLRALKERLYAVEVAQTVTNKAIASLESEDRLLKNSVQGVADAYNRIEGRLDELSELSAEMRALARQQAELVGQMKLYPQVLEQVGRDVTALRRQVSELKDVVSHKH